MDFAASDFAASLANLDRYQKNPFLKFLKLCVYSRSLARVRVVCVRVCVGGGGGGVRGGGGLIDEFTSISKL